MKEFPVNIRSVQRSLTISEDIMRKAYEIYEHVFSAQETLLEPSTCRGGFHIDELIALLYASSFPKNEWSQRVNEAIANIKTR